jgi:hypothetical protein
MERRLVATALSGGGRGVTTKGTCETQMLVMPTKDNERRPNDDYNSVV